MVNAYEDLLRRYFGDVPENSRRTALLGQLLGTRPFEAYFIVRALADTRDVAGDVCEFGVAQGETSALIANEISDTQKRLHLFDSFQGLPKPSYKDQLKDDIFSLGSIDAYEEKMSCPKNMVCSQLQRVGFSEDRLSIHCGFIEQVLRNDSSLPDVVSFAYVDFDFYKPIRSSLEFLHRVTAKGAVIVVDDYNFFRLARR